MSAERLREAVGLMRSRAAAAAPSPWVVNEEYGRDYTGEGWSTLSVDGSDGKSAAWYCDEQEGFESADHIASWHPAVALAVADWLDATAASCRLMSSPPERTVHLYFPHALAVADAYLGTPDP